MSEPHDYALMGAGASSRAIAMDDQPTYDPEWLHLGAYTWERTTTAFPNTDVPQGGTAVIGLPDLANVMESAGGLAPGLWVKLVAHGSGTAAWALAAAGLWMLAADPRVLMWLDSCGVFERCWHNVSDKLDGRLTAARRTLALQGQPALSHDEVLCLRKLGSMTIRVRGHADWKSEKHDRTVGTPVHFFPCADGTLSRGRWLRECSAYLRGFTDGAVASMLEGLRLETMDEWWESRYAWAPTGSTSMSSAVQKVLVADGLTTMDDEARPNKKTAFSLLDDAAFGAVLHSEPLKVPRASTKPEPKARLRALFAQDDASFLVSSFSSVGLERSINIDGIYASQSPSDVAGWVKRHTELSRLGATFLSMDYSNFNYEHELALLAMHDIHWSRAWRTHAGGTLIGKQKAAAAMWSAKAHLNSWVLFPGDEEHTRITGGLFSGDRNTSRDNCVLHAVYSHVMQKAATEAMPDFELLDLSMTGDDEDAAFRSWVHGLLYMTLHATAGFVLKVQKQLAGSIPCPSHEYLQRALTAHCRPSRPLAAALSQLASGNWYKDSYIWFDGVIESTNANMWELVTRGLPLWAAQRIAIHILNRVMRVRTAEGGIKLEWWRYRSCGRYSLLWQVCTPPPPKVPDGSEAVGTIDVVAGVEAWVGKCVRRFGRVLSQSSVKNYTNLCSREAMMSVHVKARNREMHRAARNTWPERSSIPTWPGPELANEPALPEATLASLVELGYAERQPSTEAELIARFGIDTALLVAIGGWKKLLAALPAQDMRYWTSIVPKPDTPTWALWEDTAIASWLVDAYGPVLELMPKRERAHPTSARMPPSAKVLLAGNASGKSTALANDVSGRLCDFDEIARGAGLLCYLRENNNARTLKLPEWLVTAMAARLTHAGTDVLMLQYPANWVLPVLRAAGLKLACVEAVSDDVTTMWARSTAKRGWDFQRCGRRSERFGMVWDAWQAASPKFTVHNSIGPAVKNCLAA
eukprot:TRINITY_DN1779_c0_g1_i2.p1 TRINITY_DN1779_c0_g1~~TRINITY_DN1779_c0_g1_i2.p1  ORF type:complete len:979 (-),score=18.20 TRINITY_DN1779_c0_g1_i2:27-2963(-)